MVKESDESEVKIRSTLPPKIMLSVYKQDDPIAGPDDEFRKVTNEETRDEDDKILHSSSNHDEFRTNSDVHNNAAKEQEEDVRDEAEFSKLNNSIIEDGILRLSSAETETGNDEDDDRSTVSELTTLEEEIEETEETETKVRSIDEQFSPNVQSESQDKNSDLQHHQQQTIKRALSLQSTSVALFDGTLLDEQEEDTEDDATSQKTTDDADDRTIESKSVIDESNKNVNKAEALAKEMQRILAENLAGFSSSTPSPSMDEMDDNGDSKFSPKGIGNTKDTTRPHSAVSTGQNNPKQNEEDDILGSTSSEPIQPPNNSSAFYYSKQTVLKLATAPGDSAKAINDEHQIEGSSFHSRSTESSSSLPGSTAVPLRRQRPVFRFRRPNPIILADTDPSTASTTASSSSPPLTRPQPFQKVLGSVIIPALFLVAAVGICRHFFHPWLKVGNEHSNAWALTWTVMCITAIVAPVFALEYMLLSGILAGTVLQKALKQYPEVKQFLKDVRRIRLQVGWWYPSEVRKLRRDLEATNTEIILKKQQQLGSDEDARALQRQMRREQEHRGRAQLEKSFDGERAGWAAVKEQLVATVSAEKERTTQLRKEFEQERQKHMELVSSKAQLEEDMEAERGTWNATRDRLENALKTAVATLEDETETKDLVRQMEIERSEDRANWENERKRLKRNIQQAEDKVVQIQQEHESNCANWENERKRLQNNIQQTEGKVVQIQQEHESNCACWENERKRLQSNIQQAEDKVVQIQQEQENNCANWENERKRLQSSIQQAEDKVVQIQQEHENKILQLDEYLAMKQTEFEGECKSLREALKNADEVSKAMADDLECQICDLKEALDAERANMETKRNAFQKLTEELQETKAAKDELECQVCRLKDEQDADRAEMEAEQNKYQKLIFQLKDINGAKAALEYQINQLKDAQELERAEVEVEQNTFQNLILELQEELQSERILVDELENRRIIFENERTNWDSTLKILESALVAAESDRDDSRRQQEQTEKLFEEERAKWQTERETFEAAKNERIRSERRLEQELLSHQSKINSQEISIAQFEKIISIQTSIGKSTEEKRKCVEADRGADSDASAEYVGDVVEARNIELSSSTDTSGDNTCASSDSSTFQSWAQRIQEIHYKEKHELLRGLLAQHLRWQSANRHVGQLLASSRAMLEATDHSSENSEGVDTFGKCLMQYTTASVSAKRYVDEFVSKTGHEDIFDIQEMPSFLSSDLEEDLNEDSVAITSNPWLRNAPLWEQLWSSLLMAKTSPFSICQGAVQRLCSGIFPGAGVNSSITTSSWGSMFLRSQTRKREE